MLEYLQNFSANHLYLGLIILFLGITISNIVPVMIFLYPDIFIFLGIFLAAKFFPWYIPWILLVIGAFIGETISYFIGRKYGIKVLEHKFFQHENVKPRIEKIRQNQVKALILGKITPGVVRIIPVLSGALKLDIKKFLIINFIMIVYSVSAVFFTWLLGIHFAFKFLGEKAWFLIGGIVIILVGWGIYKYFKNKK